MEGPSLYLAAEQLVLFKGKKVKVVSGNTKIEEIITLAQDFSLKFYEWRKEFVLRKNLKIYRAGSCPICGGRVKREKTGKRNRWSFYCSICQKLT